MTPENYLEMYRRQVLVPFVAQRPGIQRYLVDKLFRNVRRFDDNRISFDVVRKGREIPVACKAIEAGNLVEHDKFVTVTVSVPYLKEFMLIKPSDLQFRQPGENEYNATPPAQQAVNKLNEDFAELDSRFNRYEEIQAVELLTTGKLNPKDKDGNSLFKDGEIDFKMRSTHKIVLAGAALWSDTTVKKNAIIKNLRDWNRTLLVKDGLSNCALVVMGSQAYDWFITKLDPDNETSGLNSLRVERGEFAPSPEMEGVMNIGKFTELGGAQIVCYAGYYNDPWDNTEKPLFPENGVLMIGANARFDRNYGFIENMEALRGIDRFPSVVRDTEGAWWKAKLESAPLLSPYEIDKVVFATVC